MAVAAAAGDDRRCGCRGRRPACAGGRGDAGAAETPRGGRAGARQERRRWRVKGARGRSMRAAAREELKKREEGVEKNKKNIRIFSFI